MHIFFTTFINTMRQEPRTGGCCRFRRSSGRPSGEVRKSNVADGSWDYLYEPDAKDLLDGVLRRYAEALVFQMVNENMASESRRGWSR